MEREERCRCIRYAADALASLARAEAAMDAAYTFDAEGWLEIAEACGCISKPTLSKFKEELRRIRDLIWSGKRDEARERLDDIEFEVEQLIEHLCKSS